MKILYELSWLWETLGIALLAAAVCMAVSYTHLDVYKRQILETIRAGANAITYSPPSNGELFADIMQKYRGKL